MPQGTWDLSSPTRDQTHVSSIGRWTLNPVPPGKSYETFTFKLHPTAHFPSCFLSSTCLHGLVDPEERCFLVLLFILSSQHVTYRQSLMHNKDLIKVCCAPLTYSLEKAMASHSSTLAWKIPWMEEPGRLQSMGSLGVRHD